MQPALGTLQQATRLMRAGLRVKARAGGASGGLKRLFAPQAGHAALRAGYFLNALSGCRLRMQVTCMPD